MKNEKFSAFFSNAAQSVSKHSPELLIGLGIAGSIISVVLAVKATPKALKKIEETKEEKETDTLTKTETVKAAWKCYIPTAITLSSSIACVIGATSISTKRGAALVAAYKIAETSLEELKTKATEALGEEKMADVKKQIMQDRVNETPNPKKDISEGSDVYVSNDSEIWCLESLSGRYFKTTTDAINSAINRLNREMTVSSVMSVSLNEYFSELGLDETGIGDDIGWHVDTGLIDIEIGACVKDGKPCLCIDHNTMPKPNYYKYC